MRIVVDGTIYSRQRYGGINTYFNQVLPRIASQERVAVDVFLPRNCIGTPPGSPVRHLKRDFVPPRSGLSWRLDKVIEPFVERANLAILGLRTTFGRDVLFHSTYLTTLPGSLPQVAIVHDMNHELLPDAFGKYGRWLRTRYREYLRRATRIIAVSDTTRAHAIKFCDISPDLIDVVYLACDTSAFFPDGGDGARAELERSWGISAPYVLYVGTRSTAFKNFGTVLRAFSRRAGRSDLDLVVVGPPWETAEMGEIASLHLADTVKLVPHPSDTLLRQLYSLATAFVFPSLHEGFGLPLLEAMACGSPVIASDTTIFREVAGDAALYFNAHDPEDLERALEACVIESTRLEYVERGYRQVVRYSWERCAAETYAVYQKALA